MKHVKYKSDRLFLGDELWLQYVAKVKQALRIRVEGIVWIRHIRTMDSLIRDEVRRTQ